jgi:hypothetical protein
MPADHGLGALGLIMQMFGSVFLGVMALVALVPIFDSGGDSGLIIIGVLGALRATFHRMAGSALLDSTPAPGERGPYHGIVVYAAVAAAQTVGTLLVLLDGHDVTAAMAALSGIALMAWPVTLLVLLRRPRFRRMAETGVPASEDLGFEGAAVLMTLLGFIGAAFGAMVLSGVFQLGGDAVGSVEGILSVGVMGTLLVRSILHARAGLRGTSGIDTDNASDSAARYYTFGVVSSVVVGAVLLVQIMMHRLHPADLMLVGVVIYLLLVWPLALRRFFTDRNFAALLAGAHGPSYRRAPDAGLTALGWLLLATGLVLAAAALSGALFGSEYNLVHWLLSSLAMSDAGALEVTARSPFWLVGLSMAQLWAAGELITMSDRYRAAATTYGAIAAVVVLYLAWPVLADLSRYGLLAGPAGMLMYIQLAWMLVLPLGTLVLANRNLTPVAQARLRVAPPAAG